MCAKVDVDDLEVYELKLRVVNHNCKYSIQELRNRGHGHIVQDLIGDEMNGDNNRVN